MKLFAAKIARCVSFGSGSERNRREESYLGPHNFLFPAPARSAFLLDISAKVCENAVSLLRLPLLTKVYKRSDETFGIELADSNLASD